MENITGLTLGGTVWTPEFVTALDPKKCIGCGACGRVCPKGCYTYAAQPPLSI